MKTKKYKILCTSLTLVLLIISCTSTNSNEEVSLIEPSTLQQHLGDVSLSPVDPDDLDGNFKVSVDFEKIEGSEVLPEGLRLCGIQGSPLLTRDVGVKLSYSGVLESKIAKSMYLKSLTSNTIGVSKSKEKVKIGCSFSITKPGEYDENCDDTCSETSMLGGETIFCICLYDCSFEISFD